MENMKSKMLGIAALALLSEGMNQPPSINTENVSGKPLDQRPPKGCKEYMFNEFGDYYDGDNRHPFRKEDVVFKCFATNSKNAVRKFNNRIK